MTSGDSAYRFKGGHCQVCAKPVGLMRYAFTTTDLCSSCGKTVRATLNEFQKAPDVLRIEGTDGDGCQELTRTIIEKNIPLSYALSLIRQDCEDHLKRYLAISFSDGEVTQEEVDSFNRLANTLGVHGEIREEMHLLLR